MKPTLSEYKALFKQIKSEGYKVEALDTKGNRISVAESHIFGSKLAQVKNLKISDMMGQMFPEKRLVRLKDRIKAIPFTRPEDDKQFHAYQMKFWLDQGNKAELNSLRNMVNTYGMPKVLELLDKIKGEQ